MACSNVAVLFHTIKVQVFFFTETETPQISLPTSNCSPMVVNNYLKGIIKKHTSNSHIYGANSFPFIDTINLPP